MRKASTEMARSRGLNRRPLLRASSPLKHQPRTYIGIGTANGGTSIARCCSLLLVKKPLNESFQSRFAFGQARF